MEFEDMQVIWNEQNSEKLYAIDELALSKMIGKKGRSVNWQVQFIEWVMILVNFGVGFFLLYDAITDQEHAIVWVLAILYIVFACYGVYQRYGRKQVEVEFDGSMVGEVDKVIYRTNYIIRQGYRVFWWYLVPIMIAYSILMATEEEYLWLLFPVLFVPLIYFGIKWEMRKLHQPRKESLISIRKALLEEPE